MDKSLIFVRAGIILMTGLKLGDGVGADVGVIGQIYIGYEDMKALKSYNSASFDFDLVLGATLTKLAAKALKGLKSVFQNMGKTKFFTPDSLGKIKKHTETIARTYMANYNKKGKYSIVFPVAGVGAHLWMGEKDVEILAFDLILPKGILPGSSILFPL